MVDAEPSDEPVKLVASMLVHNERARYLDLAIDSLLEFCDEVRILDDASSDGGVIDRGRVFVKMRERSTFFTHEGETRQALYDWTLASDPTHVLVIDADEFIGDGPLLRRTLEERPQERTWRLWLDEIWQADDGCLCVRIDGSWGNRSVPVLFATPPAASSWRIAQRALACGREPQEVTQDSAFAALMDTEVLHFGWANKAERAARHARYATHDRGRFHAGTHLASIMWPDERVRLAAREWPPSLLSIQTNLVCRTQGRKT